MTTIGIVTGGDPGDGLDLDGSFDYALSIGADTNTFAPIKIRDATFQAMAVGEAPGATLMAGNQIPNWYVVNYAIPPTT